MSTWNKISGTTTGEFGLGFTGPKIVNNAGNLEVKTANGSALTGVTALSFTGSGANLSNVVAATAATVSNAAQPNITSTGTLTGLSVDGMTVLGGLTTISTGDLYVLGGSIDTEYNLRVEGTADFNGNVVANSAVTIKGVTTLGPVGNVKISGGTSGQMLTTDGSGNLSFTTPTSFTPFKYTREWHVSPDLGNDTTGNGSYEKPYKTIMKAHSVIISGEALFLHNGVYAENVTWTKTNTDIIGMTAGGLVDTTGTWAVGTTTGASVRIRDVSFAGTFTQNGTGRLFFRRCSVKNTFSKPSGEYLQANDTEFSAGVSITSAGNVVIKGGQTSGLTVNHASAVVNVSNLISGAVFTNTAGVLLVNDSIVYSATPTTNAITSSAGSYTYLYNATTATSSGTQARVSLAGFWSMADVRFDRANSTLTGTNLGSTSYSDALSVFGITTLGAVGNVKITGGSNGQVLTTNGSGNLSFTTVASVANADYANIAGTAYSVAVANVSGIGNIATINLSGNVDLVLDGTGTWVAKTSGPQGPQGIQGIQGEIGPQGIQGPSGGSSTHFEYKAHTTTTTGAPGTGHVLWNSATQTSATSLNFSHFDQTGDDIQIFLHLLKSGDTVILQDFNASANYQIFTVTGDHTEGAEWDTIPVSFVESGGTGTTGFANNHDLSVVFQVIGAVGPQGPAGPQGEQGVQGIQGEAGAPGATGAKGDKGDQGDQGIQGIQGIKGDTGDTGAKGDTGDTGPAGVGIATGGTTGQVLAKSSNADYATTWVTVDMAGGVKMAQVAFAFGDTTVTGPTLPIGAVVDSVSVIVDTAFANGATVAVTGFVATGDSLLTQVARYVVDQSGPALASATAIQVVVANGGSVGSGRVIVTYAIPV